MGKGQSKMDPRMNNHVTAPSARLGEIVQPGDLRYAQNRHVRTSHLSWILLVREPEQEQTHNDLT